MQKIADALLQLNDRGLAGKFPGLVSNFNLGTDKVYFNLLYDKIDSLLKIFECRLVKMDALTTPQINETSLRYSIVIDAELDNSSKANFTISCLVEITLTCGVYSSKIEYIYDNNDKANRIYFVSDYYSSCDNLSTKSEIVTDILEVVEALLCDVLNP